MKGLYGPLPPAVRNATEQAAFSGMNALGADFWPLVPEIRFLYCALLYAAFWSVAALPVALGLSAGAFETFSRARHLWDVGWTLAQVLTVWLAIFLLGALVSLPQLVALSRLEAREPTDRRGFLLRSLKVGLAAGLVDAVVLMLWLWSFIGYGWRRLTFAFAIFVVSVLCAYVVGRCEAKTVPLVGS